MKYIILILALTSLFGCKPKTEKSQTFVDIKGFKVPVDDIRSMLFYDFKQVTKFPELVDEDYKNGDLDYMFYKDEDFVTVTICGVKEEDKIKSAIDEFKSVMIKREIEQYLVVNIYETKTRISDSRASLGKLIQTMEIKQF